MYLWLRFVFFWQKGFGAKAARKMLVKLTAGANPIKLKMYFQNVFSKCIFKMYFQNDSFVPKYVCGVLNINSFTQWRSQKFVLC